MSLKTQRRLSTLVLIASLAILIWLVLYAAYTSFYDWLDGQEPYLMSERIAGFDIPPPDTDVHALADTRALANPHSPA